MDGGNRKHDSRVDLDRAANGKERERSPWSAAKQREQSEDDEQRRQHVVAIEHDCTERDGHEDEKSHRDHHLGAIRSQDGEGAHDGSQDGQPAENDEHLEREVVAQTLESEWREEGRDRTRWVLEVEVAVGQLPRDIRSAKS